MLFIGMRLARRLATAVSPVANVRVLSISCLIQLQRMLEPTKVLLTPSNRIFKFKEAVHPNHVPCIRPRRRISSELKKVNILSGGSKQVASLDRAPCVTDELIWEAFICADRRQLR